MAGSHDQRVVELGLTRGGIDSREVTQLALVLGRYGVGVWRQDRQALYVSDQVEPGAIAEVAQHLLAEHGPICRDGSFEITVCDTASCPWAQQWAVEAAMIEAAAGL